MVFEILVIGSVHFNLKIEKTNNVVILALLLPKDYPGMHNNHQSEKGEKCKRKCQAILLSTDFLISLIKSQPEN